VSPVSYGERTVKTGLAERILPAYKTRISDAEEISLRGHTLNPCSSTLDMVLSFFECGLGVTELKDVDEQRWWFISFPAIKSHVTIHQFPETDSDKTR
jgi:hypothetical protein